MASLISRFPGNSHKSLDRSFLMWVTVLTLACLWPIWWYRFLPMQDYPQHLFIAHVLSTFDSPDFDWQQNYELNSSGGAYTLTYGLLRLFSMLTTIEAAGKLLTSLYVLLMSIVVLRIARFHSGTHIPWSLLLIFPFIFNQTYFLGFQSYLLSIPLLFLALLYLGHFASHAVTIRSILYQAGILTLLFLTHPFSVLTFLIFGLVLAVVNFSQRIMFIKTTVPLALIAAVFVIWYFVSATQANAPTYDWSISWWPGEGVAAFYFMMFTGMRWFNGVNFFAVILWSSVFGLLSFFAARDWKQLQVSAPVSIFLTLALLGFTILPFWMGYYSYFNLRLAPVTYVLLAWLCANVRLPPAAGNICGILTVGLVVVSINLSAKITAETEQLLPLLAKMEKNAAVLPLLIDSGTAAIDSAIFYQLHAHDHYYYHLLVGGGVNPLPFPNPMLPLHLRQNRQWPTPHDLEQLPPNRWWEVFSRYRYILVRAHESRPTPPWSQFATTIMQSGPWTLLEVGNVLIPAIIDRP